MIIFFDGSYSNYGPACAISFWNKKTKESEICELSVNTSNQAEYEGLLLALKVAKKTAKKGEKVEIKGDSKLVVEQINDRWKINNPTLREYVVVAKERIKEIKKEGIEVEISWVGRDDNPAGWLLAERLTNKQMEYMA